MFFEEHEYHRTTGGCGVLRDLIFAAMVAAIVVLTIAAGIQ